MKYLILILILPFLALSQATITTVPSIAGLTNVYPSTTKPVVAVVSATGDKWLIYSYNAASVAATDDVYVVPTRTGVGRWLLTPWTGALTNIDVTGSASFETLEADVVDATRVLIPASIGMFGESEEHAAPLKYVRRLQVTVVDDLAAQKAIETVDLGRLSFRNDTGQMYIYCPDLIIASDDENYIRPDDIPNDGVAGRWQLYNVAGSIVEQSIADITALPVLSDSSRDALVLEGDWAGIWRYDPFSLSDTNGANIRYPDSTTTNTTQGRWEFFSSTKTTKTVEAIDDLLALDPRELSSTYVGTNTSYAASVLLDGYLDSTDSQGAQWIWDSSSTESTNIYNADRVLAVHGTPTGRWYRNDSWSPVRPRWLVNNSTAAYFAFGDSQTAGVNAAITNYTSGGYVLPEYRWVNNLATNSGMSLAFNNRGIGGARISSDAYSASFPDRSNPFAQIGRHVSTSWEGFATIMIGYNNFLYVTNGYDSVYENAVEATIARLLIDSYVTSGGVNESGAAYGTWATTGTVESGTYGDVNPFPRGNPGTDVVQWTVLDGTDTLTASVTNSPYVAVFWDSRQDGGLFNIYTNGVISRVIDSNFDYYGATTNENFPQIHWFPGNPDGITFVAITNESGRNYIWAISKMPDPNQTRTRSVIVGNIVPRIKDSEGPPYDRERRMAYGAQMATAKLRQWPVWFADVFGNMNTNTHYQWDDQSHFTPAGNAAVLAAFQNAQKADFYDSPLQTPSGIISEVAFNGAQYIGVNASPGIADAFQLSKGGTLRWELAASSAAESSTAVGSLFELRGYDNTGSFLRNYLVGYRDQSVIQIPLVNIELGSRTEASTTLAKIQGAAGSNRALQWSTGNSARWQLRVNSSAETGSDAGSNLQLYSHDDSGAAKTLLLDVGRATGDWIYHDDVIFDTTFQAKGVTTIGQTGGGSSVMNVRSGQNTVRDITFQTDSTNRWVIRTGSDTETGSNAGATFQILRRADDGTSAGTPISINRSNGRTTIGDGGLVVGSGGSKIDTIKTGIQTWDPPSLAIDEVSYVDITISGIAIGDPCIGTFNAGTNLVMMSSYVVATDTARLVLQNKTGGVIDFGSSTARITVIKP